MREAEATDKSSYPNARVISESSTPNPFPLVLCGVKFPPGMKCEPYRYESDRPRDYIIEIRRLIEHEGKVKISSLGLSKRRHWGAIINHQTISALLVGFMEGHQYASPCSGGDWPAVSPVIGPKAHPAKKLEAL
jgi:hypothetical protein